MPHCVREATLKPKPKTFVSKTVITDVFVAQVYWEAVSKTWPGGSKASVAKCVVRPWNSTRSVGGRAELTSWTFRNRMYVVRWKPHRTVQWCESPNIHRSLLSCISYILAPG